MKYNIVSTGSKGNCIILNDFIMLDCGVSYKKIEKYLNEIKIIFISHVHSDHFNKTTIKKIAFEYPNIKFVVGEYLVEELVKCGVQMKNIWGLLLEDWYNLGICNVKVDYLLHDVPNDCIHIEFPSGEKIIYATDTSDIEHIKAKDYDLYLIEANYDTDEELEQRIKQDKEKGVFSYLERVKETHLSQLQAINWLQKNMNENSEYVFIHQHIEKTKEGIEK